MSRKKGIVATAQQPVSRYTLVLFIAVPAAFFAAFSLLSLAAFVGPVI